jgi:ABC-type transport system substrate-binding protein
VIDTDRVAVDPETSPQLQGPGPGAEADRRPGRGQALLSGKTVPTIHYGVSNTSVKQKTVATQVQNDLKAAGINVVIDQIPQSPITRRSAALSAPDMARAGWCPDWPTHGA